MTEQFCRDVPELFQRKRREHFLPFHCIVLLFPKGPQRGNDNDAFLSWLRLLARWG